MPARHVTELEQLLDRARELLGTGEDGELVDANTVVNQALQIDPTSVEGWLLKCQVASAAGDDLAALAAVEMALRRAPARPEALYWRGAVLGDLCRFREALRSIEAAFAALNDDDVWLVEDLFYEKATVLEALGLGDAAANAIAAGLDRCPGSALLRAALAPVDGGGLPRAGGVEAEPTRPRTVLKVLRGGR